jgi:hypothetical protein
MEEEEAKGLKQADSVPNVKSGLCSADRSPWGSGLRQRHTIKRAGETFHKHGQRTNLHFCTTLLTTATVIWGKQQELLVKE